MSLLEVSHLSAGYGGKDVLLDVSFSVQPGQLVGVLGANGSGKTTLLKSICHILPHRGRCTVDDTNLEHLPPKRLAALCSYIPQCSGIQIDVSVLDVVLMGYNPHLGLLEHPSPAMRKQAEAMLTLVGLPGFGNFNYMELSEGQKQLCILARTLVTGSKLLLLDEPESALDLRHRTHTLVFLRQWLSKERSAVITLHDPALALNHCDALLLLNQGVLLGCIHPQLDSLESMEEQLSRLYGSVTLLCCRDKRGSEHLVMLKEQESL